MDGISKDPLWLGAQVPFVELSEKFCADPLVADSDRALTHSQTANLLATR